MQNGLIIKVENIKNTCQAILQLENDDIEIISKEIIQSINQFLFPDLLHYRNVFPNQCRKIGFSLLLVYLKLNLEPLEDLIGFLSQEIIKNQEKCQKDLIEILKQFDKEEIKELMKWFNEIIENQIKEFKNFTKFDLLNFQNTGIVYSMIIQYVEISFPLLSLDEFKIKGFSNLFGIFPRFIERIETFLSISNIISLESKILIFKIEFQNENLINKRELFYNNNNDENTTPKNTFQLLIDREDLINSSIKGFGGINCIDKIENFKIKFIGEDGQDQGGLTKEWFYLIKEEIFKKVFEQDELMSSTFDLRPNCLKENSILFGILIALALQNDDFNLDFKISKNLWQNLISFESKIENISLELLYELRPCLTKNLEKLLKEDLKNQDYISTFSFDDLIDDEIKNIQLISNGNEKQINNENKFEFIQLLSFYLLNERNKNTMKSLKIGFNRILNYNFKSLHLFNSKEINFIVNNEIKEETNFNSNNLRRIKKILKSSEISSFKTINSKENYQYLIEFWKIINEIFTFKDQKNLLFFITSTNHLSFSINLIQDFSRIYSNEPFNSTNSYQDQTKFFNLPTTSTCTNTLFLPIYPSKEILLNRLQLAIKNGTLGFGKP